MKRIVAILLTALILISAFSMVAFAETNVYTISEGNQVIDSSITTPVEINGASGTITLDNATINATGRKGETAMAEDTVGC